MQLQIFTATDIWSWFVTRLSCGWMSSSYRHVQLQTFGAGLRLWLEV